MTTIVSQARRSLAIARKDIRVYYAKGPVIIFGILFPIFLYFSFTIDRDVSAEFAIPTLLGMILFFTATAVSPLVMPWEAMARTLERMMTCPLKNETIILGDILASFVFGLVISLIVIIIGLALDVSIASPLVFGLAVVLAAFCFACLGVIFSVPPTNMPANIMMLSTLVKFPLVFISGIFISLGELSGWAQGIAYISPLTYFMDIARHSMQGEGYLSEWVDLLALLAFSVLFLMVALKLHNKTMSKRI